MGKIGAPVTVEQRTKKKATSERESFMIAGCDVVDLGFGS